MSFWKKTDKGLHWYERIGAIVATTLFLIVGLGVSITFLRHHQVGAWVPVAVGVPLGIFVLIAFAWGRRGATARNSSGVGNEMVARVQSLEQAVASSEYEKRLLWDALESIQQAIAAEDDWELDDLVQLGVLGTARGLLVRDRGEDVRLAVLVPQDADPSRWMMRWAAGHRPESVHGYDREIDKTLAGIAYRRGEFVESGSVRSDARFEPHPKETRPFESLVALPLRVGEEIVGALSVVSTRQHAFAESDSAFIKLIGAVIDVLLATERDAERWEQEAEKERKRADAAESGVSQPKESGPDT